MKQLILTITAFIMLSSFTTQAQETSVPPLINYQGMLADANGNPLAGTRKLTFNIYDAATGGNLIWGPQVFESVPLINGRFNVILGTTDNNGKLITDAFGAKERYLGIKVDSNSEIAPRQQVLSTPFAIQVENMPSPDYDSGWIQVSKNKTYKKEHNLGMLPTLVIGWQASDDKGSNLTLSYGRKFLDGNRSWGFGIKNITTTSYEVINGSHCACGNNILGCDSCYIRVLMWK